jgi:hypothetical protein
MARQPGAKLADDASLGAFLLLQKIIIRFAIGM